MDGSKPKMHNLTARAGVGEGDWDNRLVQFLHAFD